MTGNLLITGRPGVGKTTLIQRILEQFPSLEIGGFFTTEISNNGSRMGFTIHDVQGKDGLLAHVRQASPHRVGPYGVNVEEIDKVAVAALKVGIGKTDLMVIDEIGSMELCSNAFRKVVLKALDSSTPVLGTIQRSGDPFLERIRARPDLRILSLTERNREGLRRELLEEVGRIVQKARQIRART